MDTREDSYLYHHLKLQPLGESVKDSESKVLVEASKKEQGQNTCAVTCNHITFQKVMVETRTAGLTALAGDRPTPYFNCVPTLTGESL